MLFITAATILAALLQVALADDLKINTAMSPTICQPMQFTWSGGTPPYYLALIPGGQPAAPAIKQFPVQNGNSMTWMVNLPSGTQFTSSLKDSTGEQAYSDSQTVQHGPDESCVGSLDSLTAPTASPAAANKPGIASSSAASINKATSSSVASVAPKPSPGPVTPQTAMSGSSTTAHPASSAPAAAATHSNGANLAASAGAMGFAGLIGLVGAALLA